MLIKNIEQKIKLALYVSGGSFLTSIVIVAFGLYQAFHLVEDARRNIYVLDNGVPVLVQQSGIQSNRKVEYESHISLFHLYFFTLPPDDDFIKSNLARAMYLVDESGLTEYNNLKEKGYYNAILASSAVVSIKCDSIHLEKDLGSFKFYGTQRIERETSILYRELVTTGQLRDVPRTQNNPHGVLITHWKTILNRDISHERKIDF